MLDEIVHHGPRLGDLHHKGRDVRLELVREALLPLRRAFLRRHQFPRHRRGLRDGVPVRVHHLLRQVLLCRLQCRRHLLAPHEVFLELRDLLHGRHHVLAKRVELLGISAISREHVGDFAKSSVRLPVGGVEISNQLIQQRLARVERRLHERHLDLHARHANHAEGNEVIADGVHRIGEVGESSHLCLNLG